MSKVKISKDGYLGGIELNRLMLSIIENGYIDRTIRGSGGYGIIRHNSDPSFNNFKIEAGTNSGTMKIATRSYAMDASGQLIVKEVEDNIAIPDDDTYRLVKISYEEEIREVGSVSVNAEGELTGVGTNFLTTLRGQPDFPIKITFPDSSFNTRVYTVIEVIDNSNARISGDFTAESGIKYAVYGTFTPGAVIPPADSMIFSYDSCSMELVADGSSAVSGYEFFIARVKNSSGAVVIQDKRNDVWMTHLESVLMSVSSSDNPLIGVEQIVHSNKFTTRDFNIVRVGWGMRTSSWTTSSSSRKISISSCDESGKFKTVADFTDGDFDGWRIYGVDGSYRKILSSVTSGGQIELILNVLDPDDYTAGDLLRIVPDADGIQISFSADPSAPVYGDVNKILAYPIEVGYADIPMCVPVGRDSSGNAMTYGYNVKYRNVRLGLYTDWSALPSDTVSGYYNESSFDDNGVIKAPASRVRVPYTSHLTNAYILLTHNLTNYNELISYIGGNGITTTINGYGSPSGLGDALYLGVGITLADITYVKQTSPLNGGVEIVVNPNCDKIALQLTAASIDGGDARILVTHNGVTLFDSTTVTTYTKYVILERYATYWRIVATGATALPTFVPVS